MFECSRAGRRWSRVRIRVRARFWIGRSGGVVVEAF